MKHIGLADCGAITVVVALYNGRSYVRRALETVAEQTVAPAEVIVVDDGSTDGSAQVVDSTDTPFPMRVIRQDNRGQSAARNVGIGAATTDLIAFLDQDDEWRPRHLELLCRAIGKRQDIGWAYSDFDEMDSLGSTVTHRFINEHGLVHPKRTLAACLRSDVMAIPSASLMRKAALLDVGGFDEALSGYEDDDLFVRMFRADWRHIFVPKSLTRFRVHGHASETTPSSSMDRRFLESRMRYLEKLTDTVGDDYRLNRFWVRDLVLPRFFVTTVDDYSKALTRADWAHARRSAEATRQIAAMLPPRLKRRVGVGLLRYPRLCRRLLRMMRVLPPPLRRLIAPSLRVHTARRRPPWPPGVPVQPSDGEPGSAASAVDGRARIEPQQQASLQDASAHGGVRFRQGRGLRDGEASPGLVNRENHTCEQCTASCLRCVSKGIDQPTG
ncbi:MAG: glycosyltransferase family 2 protein [Candidatus Dormibacteraeota bacterium]|uniref:Glycosyltransferase family 2 protein n=1 Tax=Candidatus Amunia macphersoniae TaxID=3127014 RepID=A0A934NF76_9BACT|nr:glycosyltransferase family 2 protein [Candidatus Dormibacteraeota bacterium]